MLASATNVEEENATPWRLDDEYASEVLFDVIAPAAPYRAPEITVNGSHTYSPSSTLPSGGRSTDRAWQPSDGESSTSRIRSR